MLFIIQGNVIALTTNVKGSTKIKNIYTFSSLSSSPLFFFAIILCTFDHLVFFQRHCLQKHK